MKKNIFRLMLALAMAATFVSCSADDESEELIISNAKHFNPPTWIQGKWSEEMDTGTYLYEFTLDDFLQKILNITQSYNYIINVSATEPSERFTLVEEIKSDTRYKFKLVSNSGSLSYDFVKTGANTMKDNENSVMSFIKFQ